jgi:exodeoxyribonuclease-3
LPRTHGFTDEEREQFTALLSAGFTDVFRALWGPKRRGYTFWGHRFGGREKNAGWRLDYFLVSHALAAAVRGAAVGDERVKGTRVSDHAPLTVVFDGAKLGTSATERPTEEPAEAATSDFKASD